MPGLSGPCPSSATKGTRCPMSTYRSLHHCLVSARHDNLDLLIYIWSFPPILLCFAPSKWSKKRLHRIKVSSLLTWQRIDLLRITISLSTPDSVKSYKRCLNTILSLSTNHCQFLLIPIFQSLVSRCYCYLRSALQPTGRSDSERSKIEYFSFNIWWG